jgi:hypothetical protein
MLQLADGKLVGDVSDKDAGNHGSGSSSFARVSSPQRETL